MALRILLLMKATACQSGTLINDPVSSLSLPCHFEQAFHYKDYKKHKEVDPASFTIQFAVWYFCRFEFFLFYLFYLQSAPSVKSFLHGMLWVEWKRSLDHILLNMVFLLQSNSVETTPYREEIAFWHIPTPFLTFSTLEYYDKLLTNYFDYEQVYLELLVTIVEAKKILQYVSYSQINNTFQLVVD